MRRPVLFVCAALLALSACGDGNEDRGTVPDPTTSPSSPTPSPAPTMPDQAKENSDEGAAAFVVHWIDVFNHAAITGDTTALKELSSDECMSCDGFISSISELEDRPEGDIWEVKKNDIEVWSKPTAIVLTIRNNEDGQTKEHRLAFKLSPGPSFEVQDIVELEDDA